MEALRLRRLNLLRRLTPSNRALASFRLRRPMWGMAMPCRLNS